MKIKICSFICAICMIFSCSFLFSSCNINEESGIESARINDDGELILTYRDGTKQNLGVVVGRDGADGEDGSDGIDGVDGVDGANGVDGVDGINGIDGINGTDGSSGSVVIMGDGSNVPAASAKGLRSAVSVVCNFTMTVQSPSYRPGSSGTKKQEYSSAGSGVIYQIDKENGDAFIITNYHVVYDASSDSEDGISEDISVYLYGSEIDGKAISATYVGGSLYYDIAVLCIEESQVLRESDACMVEVDNSDLVVVGESAIAIGNAQGYGISASFGVVSVDSEYIVMTAADGKTEVSFRVMRVDTAVNSGNSGGGLYNESGKLIGIVNAKIVDDGVENIGYAIPSNVAVAVANNIIDYCYEKDCSSVQRALLGVTVVASDSRAVYNAETGLIEIKETVSVHEVSEDSIANGVFESGDVLVSAKIGDVDKKITRQYHVIDLMLEARVNDEIIFTIIRDGKEINLLVTVTEGCITSY